MVKRKLIVDAGGKQRIVEDCCPSGFIFTGYECVPITNTEKPTTYMSDGPVDCPDGYINLTGPHYGSFDYCLTDLNVIQDFIIFNPNSHPDPPYYYDERLTFGSHQEWHESTGRLRSLHYTGGNNQLITIPDSVSDLHDLEHLGLCANGITSIPTGVCNLTNLKDLALPNNNIQGSIPECIFNIPNLRDLRLGGNNLTGPIPDSIGNAVNLQYIDIHGNQLTYVPEGICNLPIDWVNCWGQNCEGAFHWQDFPNWNGYALGGNNFCPEWPSCLVDAGMYSDDGFIRNSDGYQPNYYNEDKIMENIHKYKKTYY